MMFEGKDGSKIYYNFCGDTLTNCNNSTGSIIGIDNAGNCNVLSTGIKNSWRTLSKI